MVLAESVDRGNGLSTDEGPCVPVKGSGKLSGNVEWWRAAGQRR